MIPLQAVKDWTLAVGVLTLLALDLVILTIYTALEQTLGGEVAQLIPNMEVTTGTRSL